LKPATLISRRCRRILGLAEAVAAKQEDLGVFHEPVGDGGCSVVLKRILPQSEKAVFNAESIFMRSKLP
jgi:hypothetical protein